MLYCFASHLRLSCCFSAEKLSDGTLTQFCHSRRSQPRFSAPIFILYISYPMYYLIIPFSISAILYDFPYYIAYHMIYSIVFPPLFIFIYGGIAFCGLVNIIKSPNLWLEKAESGRKIPKKRRKIGRSGQKKPKKRCF